MDKWEYIVGVIFIAFLAMFREKWIVWGSFFMFLMLAFTDAFTVHVIGKKNQKIMKR